MREVDRGGYARRGSGKIDIGQGGNIILAYEVYKSKPKGVIADE